jgi:hypothetical protein
MALTPCALTQPDKPLPALWLSLSLSRSVQARFAGIYFELELLVFTLHWSCCGYVGFV